jgi:hypothetical protein
MKSYTNKLTKYGNGEDISKWQHIDICIVEEQR